MVSHRLVPQWEEPAVECKETEVTFCNILMWVFWWKHECYTHQGHLGYLGNRRYIDRLFFHFCRGICLAHWGRELDWQQQLAMTRNMHRNISSELKQITCGIVQQKRGRVSQKQVATLKPMAPDETSPVRRHSSQAPPGLP